jgi:hypothetical protein
MIRTARILHQAEILPPVEIVGRIKLISLAISRQQTYIQDLLNGPCAEKGFRKGPVSLKRATQRIDLSIEDLKTAQGYYENILEVQSSDF